MLEVHADVGHRGGERAELAAELLKAERRRGRRAGQRQHRHGFIAREVSCEARHSTLAPATPRHPLLDGEPSRGRVLRRQMQRVTRALERGLQRGADMLRRVVALAQVQAEHPLHARRIERAARARWSDDCSDGRTATRRAPSTSPDTVLAAANRDRDCTRARARRTRRAALPCAA